MEKLEKAQLDTVGRLLDEREAVLQQEVGPAGDVGSAAHADEGGPEVGDAVDVGDARLQAGLKHLDQQRDREELIAIDAARERIANGSYGECIDCGKAIPFERLKAQPTATRCVACQSVYEKTHRSGPLLSV